MASLDQSQSIPLDEAERHGAERIEGIGFFLASAIVGAGAVMACLSTALGPLPLWAWVTTFGVEIAAGLFVGAALGRS